MVVKQALGHSSLSMTERYVTPNSQKLKDAIKKLGEI
jgi:integrase